VNNMAIINQEALEDRADELEGLGLNGVKLILVDHLDTTVSPTLAYLQVHFYNSQWLGDIASNFDPDSDILREILTISGGHSVPAGWDTGQVHVAEAVLNNPDDTFLELTVTPIGDYSTYTLTVGYKDGGEQKIDPVLSKIVFKFRPGCFTNDCAPGWEPAPEPKKDPVIDYLAKDYDSFKHTMITAMMERVPGWQATSEADLDQVLIDLFSAAADELSDFQDRVMNEAYLGTARKRVSLARHARLMDYHIHQGNQASTWLALELLDGEDIDLFPDFLTWTGGEAVDTSSVVFMSKEKQHLHHLLNHMGLYTWEHSIPALEAGSITADLQITPDCYQTDAEAVRDMIRDGEVKYLLIQEALNPATGKPGGTDPDKRQILKLLPGDEGAEALEDPVTNKWFVRVRWEEKDKLKKNYCFTVDCFENKVENISFFNGNLVRIYSGRPVGMPVSPTVNMPKKIIFREPGSHMNNKADEREYYYERTENEKWGTLCRLPDEHLLAYKNTLPGGDIPPRSTLHVEVEEEKEGSIIKDTWEEVISLVHSDDSAERGDHFVVETDEQGKSLVRFGNGINGRELPEGAVVYCIYQTGTGLEGNVGADSLINFDTGSFSKIQKVWNPLDVTNGRGPEPAAEIIRRVPEAYLYHQLRAVTLKDYEDRAEELEEVSRAAAQYAWTGSWRTVRVTIDPGGTTQLEAEVKEKVARHLEAVRLIGEDLEIRPPRFVPLEITVSLCIHPQYWPEDIKYILEQEFSEGYLPDGRKAFFHPDLWTFGQPLRTSQIFGRVQSVKGVDHVVSVSMKRWNEAAPGTNDIIAVGPNEIIRVKNDPDHMEEGSITFDIRGGRK
jgi:hypothetical protein